MKILESCDNVQVKYHSTISQYKNTLNVIKKGERCPIAFDSIDYIDCGRIVSHTAAVTDGDDIGFNYDVHDCYITTYQLLYHDQNQTVTKALPEWFGAGFYEEQLTGQALIEADNGTLGVGNKLDLRVGLNYALSDTTLPAVE